VEDRFRPIKDWEALARVRARYGLPDRFVLGLGTLQPRKNFDGLVEAFRWLLSEWGDEPEIADLHLVISGGKGWMFEDTLALVERVGLSERVHFAGFVEDADLPALYTMAAVFAFPSWYEGFGLPVLEAMACSTPVVAADNSSLPEVVGDAGLMVDASDAGGLAAALAKLLTDEVLRARLELAGAEQVRCFTWENAARQLLDLYCSGIG
jgi:glycosyltransferase involved in cell wall biosynthesis